MKTGDISCLYPVEQRNIEFVTCFLPFTKLLPFVVRGEPEVAIINAILPIVIVSESKTSSDT
jgi:Mg2+/Co2+ transporter CorC